ncbi:U-box domain-containing protein 52 [Dorcoceras hygrometricum]|uniref:U-box domain-containing protein 52 n=1 Tax=Dorcoceras hygrometricum TaxID=472368 RepID=A0A2Z7AE06_9LAMI|nr:U-box domain-containing protein 52 [Dorcoceras hygrometricum]
MAPSAPRTRVAAVLRMTQIALNNQNRMIRRLRVKLEIERRESDATKEGLETKLVEAKKEHKTNQVALEASQQTIVRLIEIGLCMSNKIEMMKAKKQQARKSNMECHHKFQARIQEAEDTIQEQHLIIEALVEEKASLLQTIQGLQEENDAPAPIDDEWKEEPEEEGLEDIPVGEGEIVDE